VILGFSGAMFSICDRLRAQNDPRIQAAQTEQFKRALEDQMRQQFQKMARS
jgi:hypothetical protein